MRSNPLIKATFLANSPCIVSRLNLLQQPLFFLSKVAVVDRLNCTLCATEVYPFTGRFSGTKSATGGSRILCHISTGTVGRDKT